MLLRQLPNVLRKEIRSVSDGIVVEHTRQWHSGEYGSDVSLHFAPVAFVYIGRQHHKSVAADVGGCFRQVDRLRGGQGRDGSHNRSTPVNRPDAGAQYVD